LCLQQAVGIRTCASRGKEVAVYDRRDSEDSCLAEKHDRGIDMFNYVAQSLRRLSVKTMEGVADFERPIPYM